MGNYNKRFIILNLSTLVFILFLVFLIFQNEYQYRVLESQIKKTKIVQTIFIKKDKYQSLISQKNNINILFFGDLIYDRWVYNRLSWHQQLSKHFDYRNSQTIKLHWIDSNFNEISKRFDFTIFNMEWPIGKYYEIDQNWNRKKIRKCWADYKSISFCSYTDILPFLKNLWFNAVNIANNHTMDWWIPGYLETIKQLEKNQIKYFGYIYWWRNYQTNHILSWKKDDILYARHGYDYSVYHFLQDKYCDTLKNYKSDWYTNFVSVHRWAEYKSIHSQTQENIAKFLIKCWADLIIWHHPHVIQDSQIISWVQVIYSLWNFLFDQYFSEETKVWWYVLINFKDNKKTSIITWTIDAYAN